MQLIASFHVLLPIAHYQSERIMITRSFDSCTSLDEVWNWYKLQRDAYLGYGNLTITLDDDVMSERE